MGLTAVERAEAVDLVPVLANGLVLRAVKHRASDSSAASAAHDLGVKGRIQVAYGWEGSARRVMGGKVEVCVRRVLASTGLLVVLLALVGAHLKRAQLTSRRALRRKRTGGLTIEKSLARNVTVLALRGRAACGALSASRSYAVVVRLLAQAAAGCPS